MPYAGQSAPGPSMSSSYQAPSHLADLNPNRNPLPSYAPHITNPYAGMSPAQLDAVRAQAAFNTNPAAAMQQQQPDFMTPAMQQYVNQFRQSQTQQQQALNAGLVQAMQGLGERRTAAANVAATLPGEYEKAYAEATKSQQQAAADSGFGHATIGGNATDKLITAANTQERAAGKGAQPLLAAGIAADYSQGRTALANTHMQNQAAVAAAQQDFDRQMLQAQMQWQQQQQQRQADYAHDREMALLQSNLANDQYSFQHPNGIGTPAQDALDKQAIGFGFNSDAEFKQAQQQGDYFRAVNALNGRTKWFVDNKTNIDATKDAGKIQLAQLLMAQNPAVYKALVAQNILPGPDVVYAPTQQKQ